MNTMNSGIYKITNKLNGKCYIGQTWDFKRRFYQHMEGKVTGYPIARAIRKYGAENFTIEKLIVVGNQEDMDKYETDCIKIFETISPNGKTRNSGP